jgi:hypothetical protein
VKHSADKWSLHFAHHTAFYGYRWVAWFIAALSLALPGQATNNLPRDAALMLLLLIFNVALTAFAYPYVRIARQRGIILALDLLASMALIWTSGGNWLPFFPYALGALVLPALIFGARGALYSSFAFIALDQIGTTWINPPVGAGEALLLSLPRLIVPLAFAFCWVAAGLALSREPSNATEPTFSSEPPLGRQRQVEATSNAALLRLSERPPEPRQRRTSAEVIDPTPMAVARAVPAPRLDPARRVLFDLTPGPNIALAETIEQIALSVGRHSGLNIRTTVVGTAQPLSQAYHMVLLRTAQEALLNVQQHAHAQHVQIALTFEARAVTLVIQDDGVGLLDGTYERPGLHALRAVRYRLVELDGQLAVFESESGGVTLRATLPFE